MNMCPVLISPAELGNGFVTRYTLQRNTYGEYNEDVILFKSYPELGSTAVLFSIVIGTVDTF